MWTFKALRHCNPYKAHLSIGPVAQTFAFKGRIVPSIQKAFKDNQFNTFLQKVLKDNPFKTHSKIP